METTNIEKEQEVVLKHFRHMTKEERLYLIIRKKKALRKGVNFSKHATERMNERHIKEKDILLGLKMGQLIEYKKEKKSEIIVVRSGFINKYNKQCYIVYSLNDNLIITTYSNYKEEAFKSKEMSEKYTPSFHINIPMFYQKLISMY